MLAATVALQCIYYTAAIASLAPKFQVPRRWKGVLTIVHQRITPVQPRSIYRSLARPQILIANARSPYTSLGLQICFEPLRGRGPYTLDVHFPLSLLLHLLPIRDTVPTSAPRRYNQIDNHTPVLRFNTPLWARSSTPTPRSAFNSILRFTAASRSLDC
jgi:hypothetical protein